GLSASATVSLTPVRQYVRADCPRYGELLGPSCFTAPDIPTAPDLFPALESRGFPPTPGLTENRPNPAPPRDSVLPDASTSPSIAGDSAPSSVAGPTPSAPPIPESPLQASVQQQSADIGGAI